jgi:hypothetical protein
MMFLLIEDMELVVFRVPIFLNLRRTSLETNITQMVILRFIVSIPTINVVSNYILLAARGVYNSNGKADFSFLH